MPGSRLVVLTTAGEPSHWSRGGARPRPRRSPGGVNEVSGPSHWLDPARLEGERRRLPESSYRRLFLNEWAASEDRLANEDDLAACVDGEAAHQTPAPGVRYIVCVDIGLKHDRTVAAVCHAEKLPGSDRPRVVLDRMGVWQGNRLRSVQLSTVEAWIEQASREYNRARIRFDPWQAAGMAQRLKARGLPVEEFTFTAATVGRLATTLLQLIREHALALPDDPDLIDELRNVRLLETSPGVYRLDHDRNRHDDRAVALALAASYLVSTATAQPIRVSRFVPGTGRVMVRRYGSDAVRPR